MSIAEILSVVAVVLSLLFVTMAGLMWWRTRIDLQAMKHAALFSAPRLRQKLVPSRVSLKVSIDIKQDIMPIESAQQKIRDWSEGFACLDASYYAYDVLKQVGEIRGLQREGFLDRWDFSVLLNAQEHRAMVRPLFSDVFLSPVPDNGGKAFKHVYSLEREPTVYAIDTATRLLFDSKWNARHTIFDRLDVDILEIQELFKPSLHFIQKCQKEDGLFADTPDSESGTNALATVGAFSTLLRLKSLYGNECEPIVELQLHALEDPSLFFRRNKTISWRSSQSEKEPDSLCATYFFLRTLSLFGQDNTFQQFVEDKSLGIVEFVKSCWDDDKGGFVSNSAGIANLSDTRYALQILRLLAAYRLGQPEVIACFDPTKILRHVLYSRREIDSRVAFSLAEKTWPSLCSTRAAINTIKLLEILRLNGAFAAEYEYRTNLQYFLSQLEGIIGFVDYCSDPITGAYLPFPRSMFTE